jgi:hypothetical protein
MQALPNTMHGGTITVTATAGMDSKTEVFDVHGIHLTGKANPSEGQEMKPGVGWYDRQRDILLFGMNRVAGKGLKLIGNATILLAGTCANEANCARNFELGFLQDLIHQERVVEYEHGRTVTRAKGEVINGTAANLPLGLRDAKSKDSVFYHDMGKQFTGDRNEQTVVFFDNPGMSRGIEIADRGKLKAARMNIRFRTWLAVRNVAWYAVDRLQSMIFICNFQWSTTGDWSGMVRW